MNVQFKPWFKKLWGVTDEGVLFDKTLIPYSKQPRIKIISAPTSNLLGTGHLTFDGRIEIITWEYKDRETAAQAIHFANQHSDAASGIDDGKKYMITSHTGTTLAVYEDYVVLEFVPYGSVVANAFRGGGTGGKHIDFDDISAIQFKEPTGVSVGFIQFTFPGSGESKQGLRDALHDENTILVSLDNLATAKEIVAYIEKRRKELKKGVSSPVVAARSKAAELKEFKELLDMGIITQEEFDAKKRQLLGL